MLIHSYAYVTMAKQREAVDLGGGRRETGRGDGTA